MLLTLQRFRNLCFTDGFKYCKRFVVRAFNYRLEKMRNCANFPNSRTFHIKPTVWKYLTNTHFIWEF
jgi:hypothetical protein